MWKAANEINEVLQIESQMARRSVPKKSKKKL